MTRLLRMGREWFKHRGDDVVDLIFEENRLTQVSRDEIPEALFQYLFALSMDTPHQMENLPDELRDEWNEVECRYEARAVSLDLANGGFRRGDDPPLENQIVSDNNRLYGYYFSPNEVKPQSCTAPIDS